MRFNLKHEYIKINSLVLSGIVRNVASILAVLARVVATRVVSATVPLARFVTSGVVVDGRP